MRVALVGAGRFGTSVAAQTSQIPGMTLVAVADPNEANGAGALEAAGWSPDQWERTDSNHTAASIARAGRAVLVPDFEALDTIQIDVVVEATGHPTIGARSALQAIRLGRHVVMVTVEADVTCGWALAREARSQGVVYSLTAGDQPGAIMELLEWSRLIGLHVVATGRGTRFYPYDAAGDPDDAFQRYGYDNNLVKRRRLNPQMYNSFRDGTKAQIEMCAVSNMTGLPPDIRGMHQPSASINDLPVLFGPRPQGGILVRDGVVDLANAVASDGTTVLPNNIETGVWAVVRSEQPLVQDDLAFYGLPTDPSGQRAVLHRPFHLCGIETPGTIAQAVLSGMSTGTSNDEPTSEVIAIAKRNLGPGDVLDGSGGRNVSGAIERAEIVAHERLLPLGLAYGTPLTRPIKAGEPIPLNAIRVIDTVITELRKN